MIVQWIKKLILVKALEVEVQGMIADNKDRELSGQCMAYTDADFNYVAAQIREIAEKP